MFSLTKLPNGGPGDAPKGASPGLGRGVHSFSCLVSGWQFVKKRDGWIKEHAFGYIGGGGAEMDQKSEIHGLFELHASLSVLEKSVHAFLVRDVKTGFCVASPDGLTH